MTKKEAAELMRVEPRTVQRWISLGRLPVIRIGFTVRIRRSDLLNAMEKYEYGDPHPPHDPSMG